MTVRHLRHPLRRHASLGIATTLLLAVAGCGGASTESEGSPEPSAPKSSGTPASEPSSGPSSGETPSDEDLGAVVAGEPEDLVWSFDQVPSDWQKTSSEAGTAQWQVAPGCLLTLQQPGGLTGTTPTQEQVVGDTVDRLAQQSKVDLQRGTVRRAQFPVTSNVDGVSQTAAVSVADFRGPRGVQGRVLAHRAGEFALVLIAVCGRGAFAETDRAEFAPFVRTLRIKATY